MTKLAMMTATELAPLIQSKQLSPVELTEHILQRIEKIDPLLKTYITPTPENALQQAQQIEKEIMKGDYKGPLHGIPIGIKDNYNTKNIRTTVGSKLFRDFIPKENATTVDKLLDAGTIVLGKQNMHELAAGSTGTNPFYGTTRNPWNVNYMPGGSSGGGTAALAAGLSTLATGTDTFGSIRQPAAICGVYGLKPTYGLVSTHGIFPTAWPLDTAGPMARSVSDIAIMLDYMAGYDSRDPASLKITPPKYSTNLDREMKNLKIGIPTYYLEGLEADVEKLFFLALRTLQQLGAEIHEITIPELEMSTYSAYSIVTSEASTVHYDWLQQYPEDYSQDIRTSFLSGTLLSPSHYIQAQQARRVMVNALKPVFDQVDVLLAPTIPYTTPAFQEQWVKQNLDVVKHSMPFTSPINLTGVPSLATPIGRDQNGLPVGMQWIGNHLSEKLLLQMGKAWESTDPLHTTLEGT